MRCGRGLLLRSRHRWPVDFRDQRQRRLQLWNGWLLGRGNGELRRRLTEACAQEGVTLRIPSPRFCADNAAMIALVGVLRLDRGASTDTELDAIASLEATGLSAS